MEVSPSSLPTSKKAVLNIMCSLITEPKLLVLDNILSSLDKSDLDVTLNVLNEYKKNGLIIFNFTTDIESSLFGDEIIITDKEKIIVSGKRSKDTIVRLLMAGVPKEKIFADRDEVESVRKYFKPKNIESIYVLYDLYAMKQKEEVHQEVKKILEDTFGKKVEE